jgi:hypothetical protein
MWSRPLELHGGRNDYSWHFGPRAWKRIQKELSEKKKSDLLLSPKGSEKEAYGSFRPQAGSFQSEDIAVLQKVFDDVWSTIATHRPTQAENDELKTMVSEKLCAIAASGVMDPVGLLNRARARLPQLALPSNVNVGIGRRAVLLDGRAVLRRRVNDVE